jgi:7-carboxy-7-deazaguanine synthase
MMVKGYKPMTGITKEIAQRRVEYDLDDTRLKEEARRNKKLPVIELFGPTIQGEGALAGKVSHFLRLGGCTYRCSWCDSMHAVDPEQVKKNATWKTQDEILEDIKKLPSSPWITLTGGDPCQHDLHHLVTRIPDDIKVAVETQGVFFPPWLQYCHLVTVSPKPPSSGMTTDMAILSAEIYRLQDWFQDGDAEVVLKVVVFNDDDYEFAKWIRDSLPYTTLYLSVGTAQKGSRPQDSNKLLTLERYRWLSEKALADPQMRDARILPQLHYLMWDNEKGR